MIPSVKWLLCCAGFLTFCCLSCSFRLTNDPATSELPAPLASAESCNGLKIALRAFPQRCRLGDEYKIDVTFTNVSDNHIAVWIPRTKIDLQVTDDNWDGKTVSYFVPKGVSMHDLGVWKDDIITLLPGQSKTVIFTMGRTVPGTMRYAARYVNRTAALKPEGADKEIAVWTGELVSTPVTVKFVK